MPRGNAGLVYMEPLQSYNPADEDNGGGVPALWQMIVANRFTIFLFALAGVAAALAISMVQTPIYDARTTLEFQSTRAEAPIGGSEGDAGGFTPESYLQTQVKVLQSNRLSERVAS